MPDNHVDRIEELERLQRRDYELHKEAVREQARRIDKMEALLKSKEYAKWRDDDSPEGESAPGVRYGEPPEEESMEHYPAQPPDAYQKGRDLLDAMDEFQSAQPPEEDSVGAQRGGDPDEFQPELITIEVPQPPEEGAE